MTAEVRRRRSKTARELAEQFAVSERAVRQAQAEPRDQYEQRVIERGEKILTWRAEGVLWREIADRLEISLNAAQKAGERARARRIAQQGHAPGASQDAPQGTAP